MVTRRAIMSWSVMVLAALVGGPAVAANGVGGLGQAAAPVSAFVEQAASASSETVVAAAQGRRLGENTALTEVLASAPIYRGQTPIEIRRAWPDASQSVMHNFICSKRPTGLVGSARISCGQ